MVAISKTLACGGGDQKVTLIDISDKDSLKTLGSVGVEGWVQSIVFLDAKTLACGGYDTKVTLIDISDREKVKVVSSYMPLEANIFETLNDKEWRLVNTQGWQFDNDERLYKYARLYDPKSKKLVPYFDMEGDRVFRSKDATELIIKRRDKH